MKTVLITFDTTLEDDELETVLRSRAESFRELDGLVQKYYLEENGTGRVAGVYLFESAASMAAFLEGDVKDSIADAYDTVGEIEIRTFDLLFPLRDEEDFPSPA